MATANLVGTWQTERYRVVRSLGAGASSEVFLAEDASGAPCALKVLRPGAAPADDARLLAEYARLTELAHRSIVRVRDVGRFEEGPHRGSIYLATDHVAGPPLTSLAELPDGDARLERFTAAARDLADALAYLHGRGVVHGDVSPANVRLDAEGRPILLDFGLSRPTAATLPGATGTLGFIAPEALVGEGGPLADLFALGATLYAAWTGVAPFGVGVEAVRRLRDGEPPPPSALRPGLPPPWDALLLRLLAFAPEDRCASARELLHEVSLRMPEAAADVALALGPPEPGGDPLAGIFVGRRRERAALRACVERLAEGAAPVAAVVVVGGAGSGRRALVERVLRDVRVDGLLGHLPEIEIAHESYATVAAASPAVEPLPLSAGWDEPERAARGRLRTIADALAARAARRPLCLVLPPGPDEHALAELVAADEHDGRLLLILPAERPLARGRSETVALPPLSPEEVAELARRAAGRAPPGSVASALVRASGGHAAIATLLVRRWVAGGSGDALADGERVASWDARLDAAFAALAPDERAVVAAGVLAGGRGELAAAIAGLAVPAYAAAARGARAAGWLDGAGAPVGEPHAAAALRGLDRPDLRGVALAACRHLPPADELRAEALAATGDTAGAASALRDHARAAYGQGRFGAAARAWRRALALGPEALAAGDRVALAGALGTIGLNDEALLVLDGMAGDAAAGTRAAVVERRAWLLGRRGDLEGASAALERELAAGPAADDAGARAALQARLARIAVSRGDFARARALAEGALGAAEPAGAVAREALVLAHAYAGRLDDAEALLAAAPPGSPQAAARLEYLRALCAQLADRPRAAAEAYARAADACAAAGDAQGAAAATSNLGCALAETGAYEDALGAFDRAVRELARLGAGVDLALALFNGGVLLAQLGDVEAAQRMLDRLRADARAPLTAAAALVLDADLRRRRGDPRAAAAAYAEGRDAFARAGAPALAAAAAVARVEALAEAGDHAGAAHALDGLDARAPGVLLARGRVALRGPVRGEDAALVAALDEAASAAHAAGRRPTAWRTTAVAARLRARAGDPDAPATLARARRLFEEVTMSTPARYRGALAADPDAPDARPPAGDGAAAVQALVDRAARAEHRLRRLLRINKRLNSDLRLQRVLETVVDTVIELTDAERGFLLLADGAGELQVRVARNIDQASLDGPELSLSRSIARQAAERAEPVVTVDATGDARFREALSVGGLRLRSVLAVPLAVKGTVVGTIYVDHRLRHGAFGEDDVALVMDFAEQGAIAIENARLLSELRRRERQVEAVGRRLERELRARGAELQDVRQELRESRDAAALRYDYRQIVGRTPRMLELLRLVDRATDTTLPVVIQGESGTGKELIARAIHHNGPRRDRPFVCENCAAIPETLLESTLFGYVKGAFTGADRDTRGLFAVADGGTLFLDEIAEMSPAMQGKVLRVLQDGELRRVGGERAQRVDVRIVAATNKDLGRLVEEGKFRQDLFFRLSVVRLTLPPLRERQEDVPLLVRHFLERTAGGAAPKAVDAAAMARLRAYRWPGNVRELENEVLRAAAFSGPRIGVADLSPHIAAGEPAAALDDGPDSLLLRPRVERLERTLIREALARNGGNQTRAAEALGLSRFGLQKKLRRYGVGA